MTAARAADAGVRGAITARLPRRSCGFLYREFFSDASKWNAILAANLPIFSAGLIEADVRIGDEYRVGTARLVVTQPRQPCFKLGIRFGDQRMVKWFRDAARPGIYFAVAEEGDVAAGDTIELVKADEHGVTVCDLFRLILDDKDDVEAVRRALRVPALAAVLREHFTERLVNLGADI